ncbi:MAG: hypothetical protein AAB922_02945 [Patescibacteria group bacterium]
MTQEPKSNCHNAPLKVISGDEGTSYWECTECNNPADPATQEKKSECFDENAVLSCGHKYGEHDQFSKECGDAVLRQVFPTPKDGEKNWPEEFDKRFTPHNPDIETFGWSKQDMNGAEQVKSFIREKIAQAKEEARAEYADKLVEMVEGNLYIEKFEGIAEDIEGNAEWKEHPLALGIKETAKQGATSLHHFLTRLKTNQ